MLLHPQRLKFHFVGFVGTARHASDEVVPSLSAISRVLNPKPETMSLRGEIKFRALANPISGYLMLGRMFLFRAIRVFRGQAVFAGLSKVLPTGAAH